MSHDAFVAADAARKGGLRGQITADARTLRLNYERVLPQEGKPMLGFDGVARFAAAKGGWTVRWRSWPTTWNCWPMAPAATRALRCRHPR